MTIIEEFGSNHWEFFSKTPLSNCFQMFPDKCSQVLGKKMVLVSIMEAEASNILQNFNKKHLVENIKSILYRELLYTFYAFLKDFCPSSMFFISILDSQYVKLMQYFLSTYLTGHIELIQYYSFLAIQHVIQHAYCPIKFLLICIEEDQ